ncbi:MAG: hypothetical protein QM500_16795 [Methylococcales bacterium]
MPSPNNHNELSIGTFNVAISMSSGVLFLDLKSMDKTNIVICETGQGDGISEQLALRFSTENIEKNQPQTIATLNKSINVGIFNINVNVDTDEHLNIYIKTAGYEQDICLKEHYGRQGKNQLRLVVNSLENQMASSGVC